MKRAVVFAASLASLLSLGSLGEGTQATKETKGTEPGGARPVATEPVGLAPRAERDESGRTVAPRPPQPARRARPPLMRRREGAIPGIVTIPYGKTASGERTHIYRIMGQGGVVADFTDYGARLVRLYTPDATADLANILEGFKPSVIACEKAGDVADVWKMTPIRRPRATGLVFEPVGSTLRADRLDTAPGGSRSRATASPLPRITYWLDAGNTLTIESFFPGTNAVKWASSLRLAPLKGRSLAVADSLGSRTYASTTNTVTLALRTGTNATEKVTLRLSPEGGR